MSGTTTKLTIEDAGKEEQETMRSVVTGLMMLVGAVIREKGHGFDDFGWRRELQQAREAHQAAPGDWDVACEREAGDRLVFDRGSLREMGGVTLFRWAPTGGVVPNDDDTIYTAVADKRVRNIWGK